MKFQNIPIRSSSNPYGGRGSPIMPPIVQAAPCGAHDSLIVVEVQDENSNWHRWAAQVPFAPLELSRTGLEWERVEMAGWRGQAGEIMGIAMRARVPDGWLYAVAAPTTDGNTRQRHHALWADFVEDTDGSIGGVLHWRREPIGGLGIALSARLGAGELVTIERPVGGTEERELVYLFEGDAPAAAPSDLAAAKATAKALVARVREDHPAMSNADILAAAQTLAEQLTRPPAKAKAPAKPATKAPAKPRKASAVKASKASTKATP